MNDTSKSNIERIVMQRVHLIHALRFAVSGGMFSTLIFILALWGLGREVWVANVLQNSPTNLFDLARFYFAAFANTSLVVQALILLTLASLFYVAREIARAIAFISTPSESF